MGSRAWRRDCAVLELIRAAFGFAGMKPATLAHLYLGPQIPVEDMRIIMRALLYQCIARV